MEEMDLIRENDKRRKAFYSRQSEKNLYLGEYKERIIVALNKDQLIEDDVYTEVLDVMKQKNAYILKMSREVKINKLKPYIKFAEELNLRYELVDGLAFEGDVGLVVAAKDALEEEPENPLVRDMDQDFIDAGLSEELSKSRGKKICSECYKKVEEKLPQYLELYRKMNIFDKITGRKCPACGK